MTREMQTLLDELLQSLVKLGNQVQVTASLVGKIGLEITKDERKTIIHPAHPIIGDHK